MEIVSSTNGGKDKQEEVRDNEPIKIAAVEKAMPELERAYKKAKDAAEDFTAVINKVSESSNIRADVLRAFVKANVNDRMDEYEVKSVQLSLLFEKVKD